MAKRRETVEHCDAPGCDYWELVGPGEAAEGYHFGRGFWVSGGGGMIPRFYAHSEECVLPALRAVIERAL